MNKLANRSNSEGFTMKIILCLAMVVSGISLPAAAQTPEAPPPEETAAEAAAPAVTASVSNEYTGLRDPFWPAGFSPTSEKQEEEVKAIEIEQAAQAADEELWITLQKQLRIAGVMAFGDKKMATVNNKNVQVGDMVSVQHEGREFRWKVSEITENNRVRFSRLEVVPIEKTPAPQNPSN